VWDASGSTAGATGGGAVVTVTDQVTTSTGEPGMRRP
jgi:hypothetical protein